MSTSPISLSAPAHVYVHPHGQQHGVIYLPVTDLGTLPLKVTVSVANLTATSKKYPAAKDVKPQLRSFTLQPGQTRKVPVAVHATPRSAETDVVFKAVPDVHGSLSLRATLASTVEIDTTGKLPVLTSKVKALHGSQSHADAPRASTLTVTRSGNLDVFTGLLVACAAIAAGVGMLWRRMNHHTGSRAAR